MSGKQEKTTQGKKQKKIEKKSKFAYNPYFLQIMWKTFF